MPSVIMCNMHDRVFESFCRLFEHIGVTVYCPKGGEENFFKYDGSSSSSAVVSRYAIPISKEECMDIKPDIVLCCCWEQVVASQKLAQELGSKFIVRAGNNNVPYMPRHSDFLISSDVQTHNRSQIKNKLFLYMPPNYDTWKKTDKWSHASKLITSYVHYYEKYWQTSYRLFNKVRNDNREFAFVNFGYQGSVKEYSPALGRAADVIAMREASLAVLHIKEREGYGWSLLESIAMGVPIIAYRPFCTDKTCYEFLKGGKTCLFIDEGDISGGFLKSARDIDRLVQIHQEGADWIRDFINIEQEGAKLSQFLEMVL
jgi:glycosyltransferase involved in cell wall biosynthesis